jgi:aromatic-L-amino-acid decarboxylase
LVSLIEEDIKEGCIPFCVVATFATTSTTSMDPIGAISEVCKKYKMWLHVDAAYGGIAAIVPEMKYMTDGWNEADSFVVNPHKWLFTPHDLSILYCKKPEILKKAFSLVPEYLKTDQNEVTNLMDYGIPLGRRFRALKLWFIMQYFGQEGLISRIREHMRLAKELSKWMDENGEFPPLGVYFSTVVFRYFPKDLKEISKKDKQSKKIVGDYINKINKVIMDSLNTTGNIFISHTVLEDRFTLRLSIGNLRTTEKHIKEAWELIKEHAKKIDSEMRSELLV